MNNLHVFRLTLSITCGLPQRSWESDPLRSPGPRANTEHCAQSVNRILETALFPVLPAKSPHRMFTPNIQ